MKPKTAQIFLSLIFVILISGCASTPPPTGYPSNKAWYQPGKSADETMRDLAICQYEAQLNAGGYSVQGETVGQTMLLSMFASSAEADRENKLINSCMVAKGYSLVATNSLLLINNPKPNANTFEIVRDSAERGNALAQFNLGLFYLNGTFGAATNYTLAIKWLQRAADQDDAAFQPHSVADLTTLPFQSPSNSIGVRPFLARAYAGRALLEYNNADWDRALVDCNKVIEIKPDVTGTYAFRGYVYQCRGDYNSAMTDYNNVIALNPNDALAYYGRGLVEYNSQKFMDALADFRKSSELGSRVQDYSCFRIFLIRARSGELDTATIDLKIYLENRKTGTQNDWPSKVGLFLSGQMAESDFFNAAEYAEKQNYLGQNCEAFFYAGSKRLIGSDKTTATVYFTNCLMTGCKQSDEYYSAKAELKSLETPK